MTDEAELRPKLSIVTAVFNRAATLPDSISSLTAQTFSDWQHVIQDGQSTDGTMESLAEHQSDPRVALVSEADTGIYDALNKGFSRATGEIVGLLHSDDILADDTVLATVVAAFEDPEVDAVYGDLHYVAETDLNRVVRIWTSGAFHPHKLRRGWMPPHPALFLRRRVIERHGLFDTSFRIAADYDAILRYFSQDGFKAVYVPQTFVLMRLGGASNGSIRRIVRKSLEDLRALRKNGIGSVGTLASKNLSKINQFLHARRQAGS